MLFSWASNCSEVPSISSDSFVMRASGDSREGEGEVGKGLARGVVYALLLELQDSLLGDVGAIVSCM